MITIDVMKEDQRFESEVRAKGYHCADCAVTAGYGIFHTNSVEEEAQKHAEKYGYPYIPRKK